MQHKRLVIDANILIRAVLGTRVRNLIWQYSGSVAFYIAETNVNEAEHYLASVLASKRGLSETLWRSTYECVLNAVQIIADSLLWEAAPAAKARIAMRDENDWPAVAAAMLLDCPVWTEDKDFFGSGIATWTTATVELYLAE
ncbi:MAG: hypothetical protein EPN21_05325 [Methylococcaceae bacterium]|nr:MAG: hypothetical protein EPN21_05325 [Methylococcaceae bacterium]